MQKFSDIRGTANARMNLDASPEVMPQGMMGEIMHMTDDGRGQLVNMKGFENVMDMAVNSAFTMPAGTFKCIGTARDVEGSSLVYFLCDTVGTAHSIMAMNTDTKALSWILRDEPLLNFKAAYRVSANVIEGLLYWTDGYFGSFLGSDYNPPRKVNIAKAARYTEKKYDGKAFAFYKVAEAASLTGNASYLNYTAYVGSSSWDSSLFGSLKVVAFALDGINRYKHSSGYGRIIYNYIDSGTYIIVTNRPWQDSTTVEKDIAGTLMTYEPGTYFGIDWQVMDVVKHPPVYKPGASFDDDGDNKTNTLKRNMYQFRYRFVYDDNEQSVWSPVSYIPLANFDETAFGNIGDMFYTRDNVIHVWVGTGPMEVSRIQIAVRRSNVGSWSMVKDIEKYDEGGSCLFTSDISALFKFYNNEIVQALDQVDTARLYDFVPISAARQEIIEKNRLIYGNYYEGFDKVVPDMTITPMVKKVDIYVNVSTSRECSGLPYTYIPDGSSHTFASLFFDMFSVFPTNYTPEDYAGKTWSFSYKLYYSNGSPAIMASASYTSTINDTIPSIVNELVTQLQSQHILAMSSSINLSTVAGGYAYTGVEMNDYLLIPSTQFVILPAYDNTQTTTTCAWLSSNYLIYTTLTFDKDNYADKYTSFKSGAYHPIALSYYDRGDRSCGALNTDEMLVYVKQQTEHVNQKYPIRNYLQWQIDHVPPMFATHYRILYAKNTYVNNFFQLYATCTRTGDKIGLLPNAIIQWTKQVVPAFNLPAYEFQPGDRVRFLCAVPKNSSSLPSEYLSGGIYESFVIDEYEPTIPPNILFIENSAMVAGLDMDNYDYIIEVLQTKESTDADNLVYYETGEEFAILNPHTESRAHQGAHGETSDDTGWQRDQVVVNGESVLPARGIMWNGDVYVRLRTTAQSDPSVMFNYKQYFVEDYSFSDFYDSDSYNAGRPSAAIDSMAFQRYISNLRYGGKLVQDTRINDLSKFTGSDFITLADKYGAINSIEEVGDTLKVIQRSKVSSVYIGRAGVTQPSADSTEILSSTKDVLGTLIVHRTDYGTVHPGSVVRFENRHYWFDFFAHSLLRDPGNGIQNLTEQHGLKRFMAEWCRTWGSPEAVTVTSGYDQENSLVWWTFNSDQGGFSVAFRDNGGSKEDGFATMGQFIPDEYGTSKYVATVFKDGQLWLMNSDNVPRCNFFGTQYKYWFTPVFNPSPLTVKRWLQILISTAKRFGAPNAGDVSVPISGNSPAGMVSLLKPAALTSVQGKMVADFGKNMTTKSLTPSNADLVNGEDLAGPCLTVRLEGSETTEHKVLAVEVKGVAI